MKKLTHKQRKAAMTILKLSQPICGKKTFFENLQLQTKLKFTDTVNDEDWQLIEKLTKKLNK